MSTPNTPRPQHFNAVVLPLLAVFAMPLLGVLALDGCGSSSASSSQATTSAPAAGAGSGAAAASGGGAAQSVTISNYAFHAPAVRVKVGGKVTWTNTDNTAHTATADNASAFDTGAIAAGKAATITPKKTGTFAYHCSFHPFMQGTLTVTS
jgi:plastocyanin